MLLSFDGELEPCWGDCTCKAAEPCDIELILIVFLRRQESIFLVALFGEPSVTMPWYAGLALPLDRVIGAR